MCKRHTHTTLATAQAAYEGKTMRLDPHELDGAERTMTQIERHERRTTRHGAGWHHGFPWWMLWLIWPLFGAVTWLAPLIRSAIMALIAQVSAIGANTASLIAILLIVAGVVLLRSNKKNSEDALWR